MQNVTAFHIFAFLMKRGTFTIVSDATNYTLYNCNSNILR